MKTNEKRAYTETFERLPSWWGSYLRHNLFRISHAPGFHPEIEQRPICRRSDRCEGCPYISYHGTLSMDELMMEDTDWKFQVEEGFQIGGIQ